MQFCTVTKSVCGEKTPCQSSRYVTALPPLKIIEGKTCKKYSPKAIMITSAIPPYFLGSKGLILNDQKLTRNYAQKTCRSGFSDLLSPERRLTSG